MAEKSSERGESANDYPMENDWQYVHGRVDPGVDESIYLVEGVPVKDSGPDGWQNLSYGTRQEKGKGNEFRTPDSTPTSSTCYLTSLPSELLSHVLSYLSPIDLTRLSSTSRLMSHHAHSDLSWQQHIQSHVPGIRLTSPAPYSSYRELYIAHDPYWFIPQHKIWFSDYFLTGKLIVTRYDPRRACIEGYRLVAERPPPTFDTWEYDDEVVIHSFNPRVRLHLDEPVLQLNPRLPFSSLQQNATLERWKAETPMPLPFQTRALTSTLLLTRALSPASITSAMSLWPPPNIPSPHRVRNASQTSFSSLGHQPVTRSEICDTAFRIKRSLQMGGHHSAARVHIGEDVTTYATLSPELYTPTEDKPYRGIWVGDYSGHGCEFLLMHQPDDVEPFDPASIVRGEEESDDGYAARVKEERRNRGRLEAIKLTGDPNIPRGEFTFVADDIGPGGFVRIADEERFKGARVVESRGHIAGRMFSNDKYIASQLILLSPNRLAQYWVGFGHISYFERVDIDSFLAPFGSSAADCVDANGS